MVFALGSRLIRPPIPGLREHAFDVDTYEAASLLGAHLAGLAGQPRSVERDTVLVIGGGLTGIEVAAEMPGRLRAGMADDPQARPRVILADRAAWIGSDMGSDARPVITGALAALGVEMRPGVTVTAIDAGGAMLATGERIAAGTVVWCAGMEANPLTACFPVVRDPSGRLPVQPSLKIGGLGAEFAAGDAAWFVIDGTHACVMSCQHGRPMGRFAGYNVVCDLLGEPTLPLAIDWYTTIVDLGPWVRSTPRAGTAGSSRSGQPPSARRRRSTASVSTRRCRGIGGRFSPPRRRPCRRPRPIPALRPFAERQGYGENSGGRCEGPRLSLSARRQ